MRATAMQPQQLGRCSRPPPPLLPAKQQQQQQQLRVPVRHQRQQQRHICCASSPAEPEGEVNSIISLPLFPLPSVLHPAQMGTVLVYEPRYLALFRDLQQAAAAASTNTSSAPGSQPQQPQQQQQQLLFGHILAPGSAPPALMADAVGGLPPVGVAASVKAIEELDGGRLAVTYQGMRRFKLLTVDDESKPYRMAAAAWLDDMTPGSTGEAGSTAQQQQQQQELIDSLEQDVFGLLRSVSKYSAMLEAAPRGGRAATRDALPDAVLMYAPPPPPARAEKHPLADTPAGHRIAMWQRSGSMYGDAGAANKRKPAADPYQLARDSIAKHRRQELFSFAAASVLELGLPERLALLQSRDTAARLQFVAVAVQPFLQELLARVSVSQAIKPS